MDEGVAGIIVVSIAIVLSLLILGHFISSCHQAEQRTLIECLRLGKSVIECKAFHEASR